MDDVLIPAPTVPFTIQSEAYPLDVISVGGVNNRPEPSTMMYITSEFFKAPTSTLTLADRWIARHSGPKSKFQLLSRTVVESQAIPPVKDEKGKVFSPPHMLAFETQGAKDHSATTGDDDYDDHYRQMFYFLPVSANHIVTARAVRRVQFFEGYPQFEPQYEHFLATLKRDTATPQSTLKGSRPLSRRFYTAYFSFEIYMPENSKGGNQWLINKSSSGRTDLWHTPEGDITVGMGVISGYDFDVTRKNQRLMGDAKGLVKNLASVVKDMNPDAYVPKLKYLELPFADRVIYGHAKEDAADRGGKIAWKLDAAYKTGKQLSLLISGPTAAMHAHEKDILAWLSQFKILQ